MSLNHIVSSAGIPFTMRLVEDGDCYGRDMQLVNNSGGALVEFYDRRFSFEDCPETGLILGQFVSRYAVETLFPEGTDPVEIPAGLNLEGGVDAWTLDAAAMSSVKHALMASGHLPNPEGMQACWIAVPDENPICVSGTALAFAPQDIREANIDLSRGAEAWVEVYGGSYSQLDLDQELNEDHQVRLEAVENGDLEDADEPDLSVPVFVTDKGDVLFVEPGYGIIEEKSAAAFHDDFGMAMPEISEDVAP